MDELKEIITNPIDDSEIIKNLILLLSKKKKLLDYTSECHSSLSEYYHKLWKGINIVLIVFSVVSFIISGLSNISHNCAEDSLQPINVVNIVMSGMISVISLYISHENFSELSKRHDVCYRNSLILSEEIEYILLKNNHTKENLQHIIEIYDEKIKSFRGSEVEIPESIKRKFIK
jgi:hypothetical protein